jgi:ADP-ribose pyrophosphatase
MLPPIPNVELEVVEDGSDPSDPPNAFLRMRRLVLRARFADGRVSEPFHYDAVARERLDAVVIAAHYRVAGERHVFLRSAVRPPVALRPREACPVPERSELGNLWELPAGLVEVDERSPEGLRRCAARELQEELGLAVTPDALVELGPSSFPCPGVIGERHFFFQVEVDPSARTTPSEDGSVLERGAAIVVLTVDRALDLVRRGQLEDAKTELALRRLAELA